MLHRQGSRKYTEVPGFSKMGAGAGVLVQRVRARRLIYFAVGGSCSLLESSNSQEVTGQQFTRGDWMHP